METLFSSDHGRACVIRTETIESLVAAFLANLDAGINSQFNISLVNVKIYDSRGGMPQQPLHNYTSLSEDRAVLRAGFSENDARFEINSGKQTIPNALAALGMAAVHPSLLWTSDTLNDVLLIGDKLYVDSMEAEVVKADNIEQVVEKDVKVPQVVEAVEVAKKEEKPQRRKRSKKKDKEEELEEVVSVTPVTQEIKIEEIPSVEEELDSISTSNVVKAFKIGFNKIDVEFGTPMEGKRCFCSTYITELFLLYINEVPLKVQALCQMCIFKFLLFV